jgi:hypothetical protein
MTQETCRSVGQLFQQSITYVQSALAVINLTVINEVYDRKMVVFIPTRRSIRMCVRWSKELLELEES